MVNPDGAKKCEACSAPLATPDFNTNFPATATFRILGFFIEAAIIYIVAALLNFINEIGINSSPRYTLYSKLFGIEAIDNTTKGVTSANGAISLIIAVTLCTAVFILLEMYVLHNSPGKWLLKMKTCTAGGFKMSTKTLLTRYVVKTVFIWVPIILTSFNGTFFFFLIIFLADGFPLAMTEAKRASHDSISGTMVINMKKRQNKM